MEREIPDFLIEQLLLGELGEEEKKKLLEDPRTAGRLEKLQKSNEEILHLYSPASMAEKIQNRIDNPETEKPRQEADVPLKEKGRIIPFFFSLKGSPLLAAAVLLLLFGLLPLFKGTLNQGTAVTIDTVRTKGYTAVLRIYREAQGGVELLFPGDRVRERDLLQISYIPGEENYGVILSLDGRGAITLHYPLSEGMSPKLSGEEEQFLPYSYQLDDAPGFERFFFITSREPIQVASVLSAAEKLSRDLKGAMQKALSISSRYSQYSILLKKE